MRSYKGYTIKVERDEEGRGFTVIVSDWSGEAIGHLFTYIRSNAWKIATAFIDRQ